VVVHNVIPIGNVVVVLKDPSAERERPRS